MAKYVCSVCGYTYDESVGDPESGIPPGTKWEDLPDDWSCPVCGASKSEFRKQGEPAVPVSSKPMPAYELPQDMAELTPLEVSALCSNLARGCEKQYRPNEASLYSELAEYFRSVAAPEESPDFKRLNDLIDNDLNTIYVSANAAASQIGDRGALRALVWSEKVSRILKSLLMRYQKEGDAMLENTGVYVCTICGFVYIGDTPPEICPVCKVPGWKFEKVEEGYRNV